ncbi:piwi domain-containing protein [Rhizophagus clarus]|uniref:Piwi domain-containing protein n=1 Tax=Rhizophagus clarus TaxID=94130 RepID=A0A8H3LTR1_9GLOM|nr:piwi domain-containing protein [Rhizophagus clarus]
MASGATKAAANIGMIVAKRPEKPGNAGKVVELKTNFIAVSTEFKYPKVHYYSFEVTDLKKKKAGRKDSQKVFEQMKKNQKFGAKALPVFDGGQVYSISQLDIGHRKETRSHSVKVPVDADGSGREKDLRVEIKYQGEIDLSPIGDYVKENSTSAWDGNVQSNLTVLNAFANNKVRLSFLSVGRKAIFPPSRDNRPIFLPGGVEMKQGFYQSVRPGWGKLTINVDICATTFYPAGPIIDLIPKIIKSKFDRHEKTRDELRRGLDRREIDTLNRFFRNVMIFVTHRTDNRKPKHRVSYIDSQPADQARFKQGNKEITIAQYFKDTYKHTLQFGRLPCIVVNKPDKTKVFFPLEVCEICPGQRYEDKLSDDARREMVQKTAIKPWERFDRIETAIKEIFRHQKDENLRSIGMDVNPEFIKVKGRVIQPPRLTNGTDIVPDGGRWDLRRFIKCPRLYNWSVMVFENRNYAPLEMVRNAIKQLCSSLSERGMDVYPDPPIEYGNPQGGYDKSLLLAAQKARITRDRPAQLIICVIQKKVLGASGIHAIIKRICGTQLGVISQCIVANNMKGQNPSRWRQICGNISLKINGKLGGKNCVLADRELNFGTSKPYMVFGADVFHPGREDKGRPSVAAVCASVDKTVTRYVGRHSMNLKIKNEIIENLEGMAVELLNQFQRENNILPFQIVFYRDGVAEGQFQHVVQKEVEALKRAFNRVYGEKGEKAQKPQLTFIVVQKRHHARFMPVQRGDSDRSGNCKPGTIVDTGIVVPQEFDFYLQSHASPLGTARPTHYHVLLNEANFPVDAIQTLTYKLCHLSARCNLAISHVTPVHYAHHIANQAKHFVSWDGASSGRSGSSGGRGGDTVPNTTKYLSETVVKFTLYGGINM